MDQEHTEGEKRSEEASSAPAELKVGEGATLDPGRLVLSSSSHGLALLTLFLRSVVTLTQQRFVGPTSIVLCLRNSRVEPKEGYCLSAV